MLLKKIACLLFGHVGDWKMYTATMPDGRQHIIAYVECITCTRCDEFDLRFNRRSPAYNAAAVNNLVREWLK